MCWAVMLCRESWVYRPKHCMFWSVNPQGCTKLPRSPYMNVDLTRSLYHTGQHKREKKLHVLGGCPMAALQWPSEGLPGKISEFSHCADWDRRPSHFPRAHEKERLIGTQIYCLQTPLSPVSLHPWACLFFQKMPPEELDECRIRGRFRPEAKTEVRSNQSSAPPQTWGKFLNISDPYFSHLLSRDDDLHPKELA